jgi:dihydrodipicolinate synthase/N-acetylneuraminate lyase
VIATRGILTALITPLNKDGTLCVECLENMIEFQAKNRVHGLFLTGTAGEGYILPLQVRVKVYEKARDFAPSKMYILPHVGASTLDAVLALARAAKDLGYRDVSIIAPAFHKPTRKGLVEYYAEIASKVDLNIVIYNNRGRQGYNVTPEDFEAIVNRVPLVKGIKDNSRDPAQLLELKVKFGHKYFVAGAGDDIIFYTFIIGAHAHVCGVSNVIPELVVDLYEKVLEGKYVEALNAQYKINLLRKQISHLTSESQEALREIGRIRGINMGHPPLQMVHEFDKAALNETIKLLESILRDNEPL